MYLTLSIVLVGLSIIVILSMCILKLNSIFTLVALLNAQIADLREAVQLQEEIRVLSDSEKARMAWNSEFDARIAELRAEVNSVNPIKVMHGVQAEEMHPNVKNLPHDAVYTSQPAYAHEAEIAD